MMGSWCLHAQMCLHAWLWSWLTQMWCLHIQMDLHTQLRLHPWLWCSCAQLCSPQSTLMPCAQCASTYGCSIHPRSCSFCL